MPALQLNDIGCCGVGTQRVTAADEVELVGRVVTVVGGIVVVLAELFLVVIEMVGSGFKAVEVEPMESIEPLIFNTEIKIASIEFEVNERTGAPQRAEL